MFLSLRSLQSAHEHLDRDVPFAQLEELGGDVYKVVSPVALSMDIDRQETGRYHVSGTLRGTIELACGRCLESFALPVSAAFDLRYVPKTENAGEGEREVEEDDLTTAFYENDQIDLSELIGEQFQLAVPMKPLCREDCKGLCPQCGTNLNTGRCDCQNTWRDPRWDALRG